MKETNQNGIIISSNGDEDLSDFDQEKQTLPDKNIRPQRRKRRWCLTFSTILLIIGFLFESYFYIQLQSDYGLIKQQLNNVQNEVTHCHTQKTALKKEIKIINKKAADEIKVLKQSLSQNKGELRSYMTPKLQAISQFRKQKGGTVTTPKGTVSELRQLMKNAEGKGIEDVIYSEDLREYRKVFVKRRADSLRNGKQHESLALCKHTVRLTEDSAKEEATDDLNQFERVRAIHRLDAYAEELPMCIVVPSFNNNARFRIEFNLNSIFMQNYTNYFAVIVNDASTDGSDELYRKYFDFYGISPVKYAYVDNPYRLTALENIYRAVTERCSADSFVLNLDGDDEFIGKNVLKIFNANYQRTKMGVIYSNYHRYRSEAVIEPGWTKQYSQQVKDAVSFRTSPQSFSHLKSHRSDLFRAIPLKQLQDDDGKFFTITSDMAIYYPLMELACGRVLKIEGYHYLYNFNTGLNDFTVKHEQQLKVEKRVRGGAKLPCDPSFSKLKL